MSETVTGATPALAGSAAAPPGLWQRFWDRLAGRQPPADAADRYVRPESPSTIGTPAQGDAYQFLVSIRWRWVDGRWSTRWRTRSTGPSRAAVWEDICIAIRCVLRGFPPNMPAEAEAALNRRLHEMATKDGTRWSARAEVSLDEAVRTQQQEAWTRVLKQEADQALAEKLVKDYRVSIRRWRALLTDVGIDDERVTPPQFIGRHLVRLAAEPTTAAEVVDRLSEHRERMDNKLLTAVVDAINGQDKINLLEADLAYNAALERLMDWAGLPLPGPSELPLMDGE